MSHTIARNTLVNRQKTQGHQRAAGMRLAISALAVLMVFVGVLGCNADKSKRASDDVAETKVSAVPLRIVSMGGETFDQRLSLAWQSVSQQPIEITAAKREELLKACEKADIVIFDNQQAGQLHAASMLAPIPEVMLGSDGIDSGVFLPALATDILPWGPEIYSVPLGAIYPAVWYSGEINLPSQPTWNEFKQITDGLEQGQVAEPLADGWAAVAFLWRAATLTREMWLFDRQSMAPQISSEPYQKALEDLIEARKKYPDNLLSPTEIWAGLNSGSLKMAIAWPTVNLSADAAPENAEVPAAMSLANYPLSAEVYLGGWSASDGQPQPPMLGPGGISAGIASSCRQTQVARSFIRWLSSRDGHSSLRGVDNLVLPNRVEQMAEDGDMGAGVLASFATDPNYAAYDNYLRTVLSQAVVRPSIRIPSAERYLAVLDAEVLSAIAGETTAAEALQRVSDQWELLTKELGVRGQINAWRQSQGMRER